MEDNKKVIVLKRVSVIFSELTNKGFGRSITIDATNSDVQKQITEWVKANNINGGTPKFKDYTDKEGTTTKQYSFKLSDYTQIAGKDSMDEKSLGYGAVVNLQARAFEYDNNFGKGISASLDGIFVVEPCKNTVMTNIAE